jgi:hypothetical protein
MRLLHANPHTDAVSDDGETYERDEHGAFELPHELAERLLGAFPHLWSVAADPAPVVPRSTLRTAQPPETSVPTEPSPEQADNPTGADPAVEDADDPEAEPEGQADAEADKPARRTRTRKTAE